MLTLQDEEYINKHILPSLNNQLITANSKVKNAASFKDLRENAAYEAAVQERDSILAQINEYNYLLGSPRYIPQSRNIIVGNKVRISPTNVKQYSTSDLSFEGSDFSIRDVKIKNEFMISEHINDPIEGFIMSNSPIIRQVYNKPSGTYKLYIGNLEREYVYEVIID